MSAAFLGGGMVLALIGLPPIDLHGPLHYLGVMDPLCGGTRATFALFRGDLHTAFIYNPGVPVLAGLAALGIVRALAGLTTRRWANVSVLPRWPVRAAVVAAAVALTVNQQLHADMLSAWGIQ